ncbi:hypothetical protein BS618_22350 [Rhodococcus erythropolis]|nr:hypothetical protein BS618_22350 [Rhodococcus erythropolis]
MVSLLAGIFGSIVVGRFQAVPRYGIDPDGGSRSGSGESFGARRCLDQAREVTQAGEMAFDGIR